MPPLGTVLRDSTALDVVRAWIERLGTGRPTAAKVAKSTPRPGA
jgi:hypothetical protein